jgi:alanine dehydrogenase
VLNLQAREDAPELGGVPGVRPARVTVIGAGVSGLNATQIAVGMGADVTVLDLNVNKLRHVDSLYRGQVKTVVSNSFELELSVLESDMVIGAVLVPGAKAPKLISNELVSRMRPGAVLVDIAIDQGGCFEDSRPTTHDDPTFTVHDTVFYCVANMPGAVPNTSTHALTKDTLRYAVARADKGWKQALRDDASLADGLNTFDGDLVYAPVAEAHGMKHRELAEVLAS